MDDLYHQISDFGGDNLNEDDLIVAYLFDLKERNRSNSKKSISVRIKNVGG